MANEYQAIVGEVSTVSIAGAAATSTCYQWPYYQWPYQFGYAVPSCCAHNLDPDEELILNAVRRDSGMKAVVLKAALAALLTSVEGKPDAC